MRSSSKQMFMRSGAPKLSLNFAWRTAEKRKDVIGLVDVKKIGTRSVSVTDRKRKCGVIDEEGTLRKRQIKYDVETAENTQLKAAHETPPDISITDEEHVGNVDASSDQDELLFDAQEVLDPTLAAHDFDEKASQDAELQAPQQYIDTEFTDTISSIQKFIRMTDDEDKKFSNRLLDVDVRFTETLANMFQTILLLDHGILTNAYKASAS